MTKLHIYLNFAGTAEEAFEFYRSVLGGEFSSLVRFDDMPMEGVDIPDEDGNKIMHISLPIGEDSILMASDTLESLGPQLRPGNNVYVSRCTRPAARRPAGSLPPWPTVARSTCPSPIRRGATTTAASRTVSVSTDGEPQPGAKRGLRAAVAAPRLQRPGTRLFIPSPRSAPRPTDVASSRSASDILADIHLASGPLCTSRGLRDRLAGRHRRQRDGVACPTSRPHRCDRRTSRH